MPKTPNLDQSHIQKLLIVKIKQVLTPYHRQSLVYLADQFIRSFNQGLATERIGFEVNLNRLGKYKINYFIVIYTHFLLRHLVNMVNVCIVIITLIYTDL